ncbi:MAG: beta-ketoacyl-ACP synthase II, partial [Candidatus Desulfovibrio faecigallinarum]|nr:beta-ketoacyl-ACP synthase II [Candidatus Desulfovibrio faecigallinarum]
GPNFVTTSACASASHALGTAYSEIVLGRIRACISGGCEATVTPLGVAGFTALKALSTHFNDNPTMSSRPFDRDRDGFVIGEGCGLLMLERLEDAQARGAKIYAEVVGYGASCDAYHMTAPEPNGTGMEWAMRNALQDAGIAPEAIGHINAHATSTKQGDVIETRALKKVFGDHAKNLHISATKSMTGHLLGAAGGIEACFTALALKEEIIPPTINLENPDEECDLDYTPNKANHVACEYALCNSFGFGGTNASIVLKKRTD